MVEIGCAKGGTTVRIAKFLRETESSSRLFAIDTFEGFIEGQFEHDAALGLGRHKRISFSINNIEYARRYAARDRSLGLEHISQISVQPFWQRMGLRQGDQPRWRDSLMHEHACRQAPTSGHRVPESAFNMEKGGPFLHMFHVRNSRAGSLQVGGTWQ